MSSCVRQESAVRLTGSIEFGVAMTWIVSLPGENVNADCGVSGPGFDEGDVIFDQTPSFSTDRGIVNKPSTANTSIAAQSPNPIA